MHSSYFVLLTTTTTTTKQTETVIICYSIVFFERGEGDGVEPTNEIWFPDVINSKHFPIQLKRPLKRETFKFQLTCVWWSDSSFLATPVCRSWYRSSRSFSLLKPAKTVQTLRHFTGTITRNQKWAPKMLDMLKWPQHVKIWKTHFEGHHLWQF